MSVELRSLNFKMNAALSKANTTCILSSYKVLLEQREFLIFIRYLFYLLEKNVKKILGVEPELYR